MRSLICAALLFAPTFASAQSEFLPLPISVTAWPGLPAPQDVAYPGGAIRLDIDATDVRRGIYRVTETIPLEAGRERITLLYPQWLPGNHAPRGPIAELAGIRFLVDGRAVPWSRDPVQVHAFHVDLPAGARELVASFIHTSPLQSSEGRVTMTSEMLNLQWEKMSLYPAGHYVRRIRVKPTVKFPRGWTAATSLDNASRSDDRVSWDETDYETLVDSPIFAGLNYRKWDLGNSVSLSAVADDPALLAAAPADIAKLDALVEEALAVFGRPPFDRYEFLVALSNRLGTIGLEHLRSSENQLEPRNFVEWRAHDWDRNVLAHELVHAWNGKYRRPAEMWTPDYAHPMRDSLLWLYEGQTQFWGWVLAARSGTQSADMVRAIIATQAGMLSEQPGRAWRSVEDTTYDPIIAARKPKPYASLTRGEDYYNEGALIWLEADQIIRDGTHGRRGLDDFARAFFSYRGGGQRTVPYDFDDIIAALNEVHAYDWVGFVRTRIQQPGQPPPLAGIERAGYRLVWKAAPNPYDQARMEDARVLNLFHSLGLTIGHEGDVSGVRWEGPAFRAGIVSGVKIVAVNGGAYDHEKLKKAVTDANSSGRIELLVRRGERLEAVTIDYTSGLRWPWLERKGRRGAGLDRLLTPRRSGVAK